MKTLLIMLLITSSSIADPTNKSDFRPGIEEPMIPGTQVPLEEMNTAPTSTPLNESDAKFRNTLKARRQKEEELQDMHAPFKMPGNSARAKKKSHGPKSEEDKSP